MVFVLGILTDAKDEKVGARLVIDGVVKDMDNVELAGCGLHAENAVIDKNGVVRAKRGKLQRICVTVASAKDARSDFAHMQWLLQQQEVLLYHGNKDKGMEPKYGGGGSANDYGPGFYTTDDIRLAKEWAWCRYTNGLHGYVHTYKIKLSGLNILNYSAMDSLHWVAEIVSNRPVNLEYRSGTIRTMQRFIHRYKLDTSSYDLIVGYRADDSYFSYVTDFMTGALMREDLDKALRFGNLGTQVCVKSERAFGLLEQVKVEEVPRSFEVSYKNREKKASSDYRQLISSARNLDGMHTINDYI